MITIPKGYDIGNLAALGRYYASATFSQAWEEHLDNVEREKLAKFSTYEYTDKNGMRQVAYSDDGKTFYDSTNKLHEVGISTDGGKTLTQKYDYIDRSGISQVAYSDDGKTFYDSTSKLHEVGTSTDGGKTIELK